MPWTKQYRTKPLKNYNLKDYRKQSTVLVSFSSTKLEWCDPLACCKKENQRYTGSSIIGISTMHKSNSVPVFSEAEAQAHAKMRRG